VLDPSNVQVADVLEEIAVQRSFVQLLDSFLEERIAETLSDRAAAVLLERRARILHERLDKPSEAADAYMRLWALRPTDAHVLEKLRMCLLETGRIQDLISAYERELGRRKDPVERASLLRDIAELWENGAKNPWEARDAWKRVLRLQPNDADAKAAIQRIERSRSKPPPPDVLDGGDEPEEVLQPEDVLESDDEAAEDVLAAGDELDADDGVTGELLQVRDVLESAEAEEDELFEGRDTRESGERLAPRAKPGDEREIAAGDRSGEASAPRTAEELSEATDALLEMLEPAPSSQSVDSSDILDDDDLLEDDEGE
jgi:tetratricopeptide (TPR) repeat protein